MNDVFPDLDARIRKAVRVFWRVRRKQAHSQGSSTGQQDQGARRAVTGGAQMDGFVELVRDLLTEGGIEKPTIHVKRRVDLPGFFRPEKKWDLLVVVGGTLLATIEFKSQVGPSFGNNFNNRCEEAIGSGTDLRTAYREGAYRPSASPWLGYLMLLEDAPKSREAVRIRESHFKVFDEFRDTSYAKRYELLLMKLVRERIYDAACLLLSDSRHGQRGEFKEPSPELAFRVFASSLLARAIAFKKTGA